MNREQKAVVIDEIAANIQDSQAIFAVDFRGITVPQAAELRDKLRAVDASFRVVKNSLTERAADQAGAAELKALLAGPTALTFVRGDPATAAKAVADYARIVQRLAFKGGVMDGVALTPEQVSAISRLLSRQALYGQLVGLVASPLTGLVRTLNALLGGLALQLGAILEKKQAGEIPAGVSPADAASPPVDEPVPAPAEEAPPAVDEPVPAAAEAAPPPVDEPVPAPAEAAPSAVDESVPAAAEEVEEVDDPVPTPAEEASAVTRAEPSPPATLTTHDSGEEVAGPQAAQTDEAQAEQVQATAVPATDEPPSDKENH